MHAQITGHRDAGAAMPSPLDRLRFPADSDDDWASDDSAEE